MRRANRFAPVPQMTKDRRKTLAPCLGDTEVIRWRLASVSVVRDVRSGGRSGHPKARPRHQRDRKPNILRHRPLPRRWLALDRMDVDGPQPAHPQHIHFDGAFDAVTIEHTNQIVDAIDADAVELDHDIAGQ
jgi:hypothetical protein